MGPWPIATGGAVMLGGLMLFALGSVACALAPTLDGLIGARVLQSAGGAIGGMVLPRAVVRDRFGPERAAGLIAQLSMVMVVAPMVAPALGGVLTDLIDWRAVFWFTAGAGLLIFLLVFFALPETLPRSSPDLRGRPPSGFWLRLGSARYRATWATRQLVHDLLCLHQRGALSDGEHAGAGSDGLWDVVHHHLPWL